MIDPARSRRSASSSCRSSPATRRKGFAAGETIPLAACTPGTGRHRPVLRHVRRTDPEGDPAQNLAGFGNALAGRGPQLNEAFGALRRLVENGQPVLRTIVAPSTNFGGFWRALEDLSATVAPVAETQASMFVALDRTFAAFARVSRPYIQETIAKGPPTLDAVNADLPALRPFLRDSERFFTALQAGRQGARRNLAGRSPPPCTPASRRSTPRRSSTPSCRRPPKRCSPSRTRPASSTASTC